MKACRIPTIHVRYSVCEACTCAVSVERLAEPESATAVAAYALEAQQNADCDFRSAIVQHQD